MTAMQKPPEHIVRDNVLSALQEDVGDGDLTAALVAEDSKASANIVARENCVLAGRPWADEVFDQVDSRITIEWQHQDGDRIGAGETLCQLAGPARALLTGERCALNFLQTLSATATETAKYVAAVAHTDARILDTRKTLPGLRHAQKYAVLCGGGNNHRIGLFDAMLVKENHIASAGGIAAAVTKARAVNDAVMLEVEVETLEQLREALSVGVTRILLDNFDNEALRTAVALNQEVGNPPADLEASGGLTLDELRAVAETGVDFISVGALTKHVRAVDLSMRFDA